MFLGEFRGAAHSTCNLQYRIDPDRVKIPVIIHNLKNYDSHLILSAVKPRHGTVSCIPNNSEKYTSFSIGGVTFIDSCQFMQSSLDKLASNLSEFPETKKFVENKVPTVDDITQLKIAEFIDEEEIADFSDYRDHPHQPLLLNSKQKIMVKELMSLMTRKGVYPYEYFDCWEKFHEIKLPEKEKFFSQLTDSHISDKDYQNALNVFNSLKMQSLREYHDFYLVCDVLLLADVFEAFRDTCKKNYDLDPAHFYTAPGLSWQAALKMTGVKLELLTDIDQHLFIEAGIRGGVSTISHRYAKSNIPGEEGYDDSQPIEHLIYWDANNLYGWAMSQYLPVSDFKWMTEGKLHNFNVNEIDDQHTAGYILEVDLRKFILSCIIFV